MTRDDIASRFGRIMSGRSCEKKKLLSMIMGQKCGLPPALLVPLPLSSPLCPPFLCTCNCNFQAANRTAHMELQLDQANKELARRPGVQQHQVRAMAVLAV